MCDEQCKCEESSSEIRELGFQMECRGLWRSIVIDIVNKNELITSNSVTNFANHVVDEYIKKFG